MTAYLPFVPLAQGVRIGDSVPDLVPFCRQIEAELGELRRAARRSRRRAS